VVLQVDEKGTEAAAVTASPGMCMCTPRNKPLPEVVFDRPFLFIIVHDATSTPLFVCLVMNPAAGLDLLEQPAQANLFEQQAQARRSRLLACFGR
jgi:hypothetical protein